ncbi:MAG: hypothetical protein VX079_14315 [Pseudomonadota bacterium]|nr:hypothetical protein [Pseudomonadota bacterium]MEC8204745.1 hypothetical protein [Pseudomonadota bacterium]
MLREVMDVLEFLDDARNGAEPFAALLSDSPQSVEITPFESDIVKLILSKFCFQVHRVNPAAVMRRRPA